MTVGRASNEIEKEILAITDLVVTDEDVGKLRCTVHGTGSGISAAFIDALDRKDKTGRSSEQLHELIVEYAGSVTGTDGETPEVVEIQFSRGQTRFINE